MEISSCIVHGLITVLALSYPFAEGRHVAGPKDIVKSIKVDDGDIVDCVDIYKQPALSHPILKDHSIQIKPSMDTSSSISNNDLLDKLGQSWQKNGHCPNGSIPIRRKHKPNFHFRRRKAPSDLTDSLAYHQYASIQTHISVGTFLGAHAVLNVWNPKVEQLDFSLSEMWVVAGDGTSLNTIEVGWHVFPEIRGDNETRLFTFWTNDGYQSGCYDLECPGFVQTNPQVVLGARLGKLSTYNGQQFELEISIQKDILFGHWWLNIHGIPIGYWPASIFTTMSNAADYVSYGGEVFDSTGGGAKHSSTQMGSGHFASEGFRKSSYIRGLKYVDTSGSEVKLSKHDVLSAATSPSCYDYVLEENPELFLYFGGPGCP